MYDLTADNGNAINIVTGPIGATPQVVNDPANVFQKTCNDFLGSFCADGGETNVVVGGPGSLSLEYLLIDNFSLKKSCPLTFDCNIIESGVADCAGSCVTLTADPQNQAGGCEVTNDFTYLWSTGETTQSIQVCPTGGTTASVDITYNAGCKTVVSTIVCLRNHLDN